MAKCQCPLPPRRNKLIKFDAKLVGHATHVAFQPATEAATLAHIEAVRWHGTQREKPFSLESGSLLGYDGGLRIDKWEMSVITCS